MLLVLIFALLAPAITLGLYFAFLTAISPLWMLLIAFGLFWLLCLFYLVFLYVSGELSSKETPDRISPYHRWVTIHSLQWFMCLFRVRIRLKGKEKLPQEPFILVSNHRGALDPVMAICAMPKRRMAFIAKSSVMRYPVVGPYVRKCCFLGIERDKPLQSLRVLNRAARYVKEEGMDFGIYPEGTRTKNGKLGAFKSGAFLAAKKADAPIVVMTTEGTESIWKHVPFGSPKVVLTVCEVIPAEMVRAETPEELSDRARAIMLNALGEEDTLPQEDAPSSAV